MQSVSPVFTDEEVQFEREIAKNQPEYLTVIGLPVTLQILDREDPNKTQLVENWAISIRLRLTPEERAKVAAGLDLVVTQLTFGKDLAPMNFQFCPAKTKPVFEMIDTPPAAEDPDVQNMRIMAEASNVVEMPALCEDEGCPNAGIDHVCIDKPEPKGEPLGSCAFESDHQPAEDQPQSEG